MPNILFYLMFIGPCIIVIVEDWKTNLLSLAILFHFLCAQHIWDINISIFRSLQLCCWITTSVVLFSVRCVLEAEACNTSTTKTQPHQISNTQRTENKTTYVVIQQHSCKLLKMDILMSETCWAHKKWNKIASDIKLVFQSSTILFYVSTVWTLQMINSFLYCLIKTFMWTSKFLFYMKILTL